jgi:hypothetical protein
MILLINTVFSLLQSTIATIAILILTILDFWKGNLEGKFGG